MGKIITREEKSARIQEKFQTIQTLYDLAFEDIKSSLIVPKKFKISLNLKENEKDVMRTILTLKKQIELLKNMYELYPAHEELLTLIERISEVQNCIRKSLKKEFRNPRNRFETIDLNI